MSTADNFEDKLDRLIELCQQLKAENRALREREAGLMGERGQLLTEAKEGSTFPSYCMRELCYVCF